MNNFERRQQRLTHEISIKAKKTKLLAKNPFFRKELLNRNFPTFQNKIYARTILVLFLISARISGKKPFRILVKIDQRKKMAHRFNRHEYFPSLVCWTSFQRGRRSWKNELRGQRERERSSKSRTQGALRGRDTCSPEAARSHASMIRISLFVLVGAPSGIKL